MKTKINPHREYTEKSIDLNVMSTKRTLDRLGALGVKLLRIKNDLGSPTAVNLHMKEFSSLCPVKGFPDYAEIDIKFTLPAKKGNFIEQKSLRDFLNAFRNMNVFQEEATAALYDALANCIGIKTDLTVNIAWVGRGGISNRVEVSK